VFDDNAANDWWSRVVFSSLGRQRACALVDRQGKTTSGAGYGSATAETELRGGGGTYGEKSEAIITSRNTRPRPAPILVLFRFYERIFSFTTYFSFNSKFTFYVTVCELRVSCTYHRVFPRQFVPRVATDVCWLL